MTVRISAVVCTHNRVPYLKKAIQSLLGQRLHRSAFEIIVVDNASTGNTKRVVDAYVGKIANFSYVYEPQLGLSQARNTGFRHAVGEFIAYLDDDAVASENWLSSALKAFDTTAPQVGCVAGKVDPIWEAPRPLWLPDELLPYLTVLNLSEKARFLANSELIVGTNMVFPRACLEKVGGFSSSLGRKGKRLLSNEELVLRKLLEQQGFRTYYEPKMCVGHYVARERLCKRWFTKRLFWQGVSEVAGNQLLTRGHPTFADLMKARRKLAGSYRRWKNSVKRGYSKDQTFLRACESARALGQLWSQIRLWSRYRLRISRIL